MLIATGFLAVILSVLLILRTDSKVAEWMAANLSRGYISLLSRITSVFPFSLYETFIYLVIIGGIALVTTAIVFFCKKKALRAVTYLLAILLIGLTVGDLYTFSAGFAYYRDEVDVPQYTEQYLMKQQRDEILAIASFMIDDFNALSDKMTRDEDGKTVSPYSNKQLSDKLKEEYKRLDSDYFSSFTPSAKVITSKKIMTNMHITGVFFAPFGEANVNPLTPAAEMPVTMAHEMAHAKGVMREDDANLVAYWLTLTSDDDYIRYSGYYECYYRIMSIVSYYDGLMNENNSGDIGGKMDKAIRTEMSLNNKFWSEYTLFDKITDTLNDLYLKLQGQNKGTDSYYEPVIPPGDIVVPGDDGEDKVEPVYFINHVQRVAILAIKDRMKNE